MTVTGEKLSRKKGRGKGGRGRGKEEVEERRSRRGEKRVLSSIPSELFQEDTREVK